MKRLLFLATLFFSALPGLSAANPEGHDQPIEPTRAELEKLGGFDPMPAGPEEFNIHIELLIVEVPNADAIKLLPQLRDAQQIQKACDTLLEMIGQKRALLIGWPTLITKSGNRAVTENINEVRYPIEFEGGGTVLLSDAAAPNPPDAAAPKEEKKPEEKTRPAPTLSQGVIHNDPIPTTFETRNAGVTLEIEPNLSTSDMIIDAQLAPQHVFFNGMEKHTVGTADRQTTLEQPNFRTNKISTNISVRSGQPMLIGSFSAPDKEGWMELFVIKMTALRLPTKAAAPAAK